MQIGAGGVLAAGNLNQFVQLKSENSRLTEEVAKLRKRLEDDKLNSTGSFQTVPIPGEHRTFDWQPQRSSRPKRICVEN